MILPVGIFSPSAGRTAHQDGESLFNIDGIVPPKCGNQRVVGFGVSLATLSGMLLGYMNSHSAGGTTKANHRRSI